MIRPSGSLPRLTLARASRLLESSRVSSEELCMYCHALAVAGEENWHLNAFTQLTDLAGLLEQARASDFRRRTSERLSPLDGLPVCIKSNLAVACEPLTAASRILGCDSQDTPPCGYDADVVEILLHQCGAVLVGVTNMDEFGMGSLGTNVAASAATGASLTRNPTPYLQMLELDTPPDIENDDSMAEFIRTAPKSVLSAHKDAFAKYDGPVYSAGGSSCGSAASIAHGSSLLALGTDTGGSIRLPAAWCGVVGVKPSYGLISRHGLVSYASSLDTVGILAPTSSCATLALRELSERVQSPCRDSTASSFRQHSKMYDSTKGEEDGSAGGESSRLRGIEIGVPEAFSVTECTAFIRHAWAHAAACLNHHGAIIQTVPASTVSPEIIQHSLAAYYVLASAEASSNLNRYDGLRYGVSAKQKAETDEAFDKDVTRLAGQYSETRVQYFGQEVMRRILCGTSVLSSDRFHSHYEAAARLRAVLTQQLISALTEVDLLLVPTALSFPCPLDKPIDNTEMFGNDVMTVPFSLAGLPVASVPVSLSTDDTEAPFVASMQLVGSRLAEEQLLDVARVMEQSCD